MKMDAKAFEQSPTQKITFEISYHLKHGGRAHTGTQQSSRATKHHTAIVDNGNQLQILFILCRFAHILI